MARVTNNYFKLGSTIVPFDGTSKEDTEFAYRTLCLVASQAEISGSPLGVMSMWTVPEYAGDWDQLPVIGWAYRTEEEVQADLETAKQDRDHEGVFIFSRELALLQIRAGSRIQHEAA